MNHDELRDSIPALALHALPRAEQVVVEAHVSRCSGCSFEYRQYQEVAALLAHLAPAVVPPPRLWDRIEQGLGAEARPAPVRAPYSPVAPASGNGTRPPAELRGWFSRQRVAALATAAVLVAGGIGVSLLNRPGSQAPQGSHRDEGLFQAIVSGPHTTMQMHGTALAREVSGEVFVAPDGKVAVAIHHLPAPASGTYAMWLMVDGQGRPLGDFRPDASGEVRMATSLTTGHEPVLVATLESRAGNSSPTGQPILNV